MIKIYYLKNCPHSLEALETLDKYNIDNEQIESRSIRDERKEHHPTFPQIYWGKKLIGGNDNLNNIITILQSNTVPSEPKNFDKKEWRAFLLNIAVKL